MDIHELKILPKYFKDVVEGNKTFEIRKDDRDYKVGDILILKEYDLSNLRKITEGNYTHYTCKKIVKKISYVLKDIPEFGLKEGYVLLGIKETDKDTELEWKSNMVEWGEIYCEELGKDVMTYYPSGTPAYDTITNPFMSDDGDIYYFKYDQDEGYWKDGAIYLCDCDEWQSLKEILWY